MFDESGFLIDHTQWNKKIATTLAQKDGVILKAIHWEVIDFLQHYYLKNGIFPLQRNIIFHCAKKFNLANPSSELFLHFAKGGPLLQGARYAGLPKPEYCIDWN